jgi:DNA-binding SARP family transcriptional activator
MPPRDTTRTGVRAVRLLGAFALIVDGREVALPMPSRRLVALLGAHDRPLLRGYIAGLLWPDAPQAKATTNLRSALRPLDSAVVERSKTHLRLAPGVAVDLHRALRLADDVLSGRVEPAAVDDFFDVLGDDLLPDWPDEWAEPYRARHRHLRLAALETIAESLLDAGNARLAAEACFTVTEADPLRESAHLLLINADLAMGNRAQAIQHYGDVCRLLQAELGMPPSFRLPEAATAPSSRRAEPRHVVPRSRSHHAGATAAS